MRAREIRTTRDGLTIAIPPRLAARLKIEAEASGRTVDELARAALEAWLGVVAPDDVALLEEVEKRWAADAA